MKIIKATTTRGQAMLNSAKNYEGYTLADVYGNYSQAKNSAWWYCYNTYYNENGANFRIISHNTFSFSVAWEITSPETGEIIGTRIETANNSYFVKYNY